MWIVATRSCPKWPAHPEDTCHHIPSWSWRRGQSQGSSPKGTRPWAWCNCSPQAFQLSHSWHWCCKCWWHITDNGKRIHHCVIAWERDDIFLLQASMATPMAFMYRENWASMQSCWLTLPLIPSALTLFSHPRREKAHGLLFLPMPRKWFADFMIWGK